MSNVLIDLTFESYFALKVILTDDNESKAVYQYQNQVRLFFSLSDQFLSFT
jgi:hypothetical protein